MKEHSYLAFVPNNTDNKISSKDMLFIGEILMDRGMDLRVPLIEGLGCTFTMGALYGDRYNQRGEVSEYVHRLKNQKKNYIVHDTDSVRLFLGRFVDLSKLNATQLMEAETIVSALFGLNGDHPIDFIIWSSRKTKRTKFTSWLLEIIAKAYHIPMYDIAELDMDMLDEELSKFDYLLAEGE